jgi:hypothetical protein
VLILKGIEILSLEMFHNDGKENPNGTYNNSKKNAALIDAYLDHAYLCVRVRQHVKIDMNESFY